MDINNLSIKKWELLNQREQLDFSLDMKEKARSTFGNNKHTPDPKKYFEFCAKLDRLTNLDEMVHDGEFIWSRWCDKCGKRSVEVVSKGKIRCNNCD